MAFRKGANGDKWGTWYLVCRIRSTAHSLRRCKDITCRRHSAFMLRKGTNGVSTNGVTANFVSVDGGTFWALPLTYVYIPRSARAYLFPQSVKSVTFAAAPLSGISKRGFSRYGFCMAGSVWSKSG